ncbi:MAG: HEAT repeat domain-containing protein [Planctomycetia bacterium]|nr:HEAT repeat domain-containing protein [Planctomycetia bacterium]
MTAFFNRMNPCVPIGLFIAIVCFPVFATSRDEVLWADQLPGEEGLDIKFNNGKLSAKLKNSPLEKVLKEVMSQSGAKIWLNDSIDGTVTIEFKNIPIGEGVRRMLKDKNYAFVFARQDAREGKLSIVRASKSKEIFTKVNEEPPRKFPQKTVLPVAKKDKPKKEPQSFESLVKDALENEDPGKREDAIIALGESKDKKAIEVISKALANDPTEDVRLSAIDALLDIGDTSIVDPLSIALKDRDPWVRESAVEALGEIGGETAIEFIKNALNDEDGSVRELAQETLEELNAKK